MTENGKSSNLKSTDENHKVTNLQHTLLNMRKPSLLERLRAKKRNRAIMVGVTWYTAETWAQVKSSAADPERFEESFPQWETMAISALREFLRSGVQAVKCQIIPEEFFAWCALNNKVNNAESRAEFVSEKLQAAHDTRT
jgi:hypothetical protein